MVPSSCWPNGGRAGRKQDEVVGGEAELGQGVQLDAVLNRAGEGDLPVSLG